MREFRSGSGDQQAERAGGGGWGIAAGKQTRSEQGADVGGGEASAVRSVGKALQLAVAEAIGPAGPASPVSATSGGDRGAVAAAGVASASGPLPQHEAIQRSFGKHDLSGLAVASDAAAGGASEQLGAQAYTFGRKIALGRGTGLRVQAHEATHYLQQRAGKVSGHGQEGDRHEQEAERIAELVERGESAEAQLDELLGAQGRQGAAGEAGAEAAGEAGAEAVQCLSTTTGDIQQKWGVPNAHPLLANAHYLALIAALTAYETPPAGAVPPGPAGLASIQIPLISTLLEAARTFRTRFPIAFPPPGPALPGAPAPLILHKRITTQLTSLLNELHKELDVQLQASAKDDTQRTLAGDRALTPIERVNGAAAQVAGGAAMQNEAKLLLRYQQRLGFVGQLKESVADSDGPAILQSWRARGDMYHVGAVMNLFPRLKVILYDLPRPPAVKDEASHDSALEAAERWKQAVMISEYYGQADRVFYTHAGDVSQRGDKGDAYTFHQGIASGQAVDAQRGLFIDVGGCTTIVGLAMQHARGQGDAAYKKARGDLAAAVAPDPKADDGRADRAEIQHFFEQKGWDDTTKYVIINYRGSGHAQIEKQIRGVPAGPARQQILNAYNPATDQEGGNHPDLDTGVVGIEQLAQIVRDRGFTPIFMGEEPAGTPHPHLIKYWEFEHLYARPPRDGEAPAAPVQQKLCRGGRASEAFLLRALTEVYDVRLLAMRSGVTDQLAFLNMPTISIDVDNFHQAAAPALLNVPAYQRPSDAVAHSWARGGKLEAGLERDYGRVFLEEERNLKSVSPDGKWNGKFSDHDVASIDSAVGFYFGKADEPAPASNGIRHQSHPLHPDKLEATGGQSAQADAELRKALPGKIDTNLNPDVVLAHARSVLAADPPDVAEARKFLDGHLEYVRVGQVGVGVDEAAFKADKLKQQLSFLGGAVAMLAAHGNAGDAYRLEKTTIEGGLATNRRRLAAVKRSLDGIAGVHGSLELALTRLFDPKVKIAAPERAALAPIDLAPMLALLAPAEALVGVEDAAAFHTRLSAAVTASVPVFTRLLAMSTAAKDRLAGQGFYQRPFKEAFDRLTAITLPSIGSLLA
jgi:Domain of unknown function (DUF4157)